MHNRRRFVENVGCVDRSKHDQGDTCPDFSARHFPAHAAPAVRRDKLVELKAWRDDALREISLPVNLSARQFQQKDLALVVAEALRVNEIQPKHLELEVTESAVMKDRSAGDDHPAWHVRAASLGAPL